MKDNKSLILIKNFKNIKRLKSILKKIRMKIKFQMILVWEVTKFKIIRNKKDNNQYLNKSQKERDIKVMNSAQYVY